MYLIKKTFRKNNETLFYHDNAFETYQKKMYSNKWSHEHEIQEEDILRIIHVWPSEEVYQRWANDPTVRTFISKLEEHNIQNQITCNEIRTTV